MPGSSYDWLLRPMWAQVVRTSTGLEGHRIRHRWGLTARWQWRRWWGGAAAGARQPLACDSGTGSTRKTGAWKAGGRHLVSWESKQQSLPSNRRSPTEMASTGGQNCPFSVTDSWRTWGRGSIQVSPTGNQTASLEAVTHSWPSKGNWHLCPQLVTSLSPWFLPLPPCYQSCIQQRFTNRFLKSQTSPISPSFLLQALTPLGTA